VTLYAESSAVLRWLFDEGDAGAILEHLRQAAKVVCSRLTLIECRRVVQRATIEGRVGEAAAGDALAAFARAAASWAVLELTREVADRAEARSRSNRCARSTRSTLRARSRCGRRLPISSC
jgi:uncharacterized protein with PIN domain